MADSGLADWCCEIEGPDMREVEDDAGRIAIEAAKGGCLGEDLMIGTMLSSKAGL